MDRGGLLVTAAIGGIQEVASYGSNGVNRTYKKTHKRRKHMVRKTWGLGYQWGGLWGFFKYKQLIKCFFLNNKGNTIISDVADDENHRLQQQ